MSSTLKASVVAILFAITSIYVMAYRTQPASRAVQSKDMDMIFRDTAGACVRVRLSTQPDRGRLPCSAQG